jgi:hypothetical protein
VAVGGEGLHRYEPVRTVEPSRVLQDDGDPPPHRVAPPHAWPWLPAQGGGSGTLAKHPYCEGCGVVRYIGSQRALNLGGLANLLARVEILLKQRTGRKVTEAQRRMIVLRLAALRADDAWAFSREGQRRLVAKVIGKQIGLEADVVESYLHSC